MERANGRGKKVVVLGGAGYLGSVLVRRLLDSDFSVTIADAFIYGDQGIRDLTDRHTVNIAPGDMRDPEFVSSVLDKTDAVVLLAAIVGDPACSLSPQLAHQINVDAVRTVLRAAEKKKVKRLIFASSCSVYGASNKVMDETSPLNPVGVYSETKVQAEGIVLEKSSDRFACTVLRFATLYGLSYRPRFDLVINKWSAVATLKRVLEVHGGQQWRPFLHVQDASDACVLCLNAPREKISGQIFNVGSEEQNLRLLDAADIIATSVGGAEVVIKQDQTDARNYRVSFTKVHDVLGFEPKRTLSDGANEIAWAIRDGVIRTIDQATFHNEEMIQKYLSQSRKLGIMGDGGANAL